MGGYGGDHDTLTVDETINFYLIDRTRCPANDCKQCRTGVFGFARETIRYTVTPQATNGIVDLVIKRNQNNEVEKTLPFGCYRETNNGDNFAFVHNGAKTTGMWWDCAIKLKDDYKRKYEVFFAK